MEIEGGGKGRLTGCDIADNGQGGLSMKEGGGAIVVGCTIRDHRVTARAGSGYGVLLQSGARTKASKATLEMSNNVFERNDRGDVVAG